MNPETQNQMNPDQAAAALAMATRISEGVMPKNPPPQLEEQEEMPEEMPMEGMAEEPVEEPVETEDPEDPEESNKIDELSKSFESFKGEVKGMIEANLEQIKDMLGKAER